MDPLPTPEELALDGLDRNWAARWRCGAGAGHCTRRLADRPLRDRRRNMVQVPARLIGRDRSCGCAIGVRRVGSRCLREHDGYGRGAGPAESVVVYAAGRRPMSGTGADRVGGRERRRAAAGHAGLVWRVDSGVGDSARGASDVRGLSRRTGRDVLRPRALDGTACAAAGQPCRHRRHQRRPRGGNALRAASFAAAARRAHCVRLSTTERSLD